MSNTKKTTTAKAAPAAAKTPQVLAVKKDRAIHWPSGQIKGQGAGREVIGHKGDGTPIFGERPADCFWADDPFIKGYSHCLEPAPAGAQPVPFSKWPTAYQKEAAISAGAEFVERATTVVKQDARAQTDAKEAAKDTDLPGLDPE